MQGIRSMLNSRKFWITVLGSAVVTALSMTGVPSEIVVVVASLFGVNIGAQGIADLKK